MEDALRSALPTISFFEGKAFGPYDFQFPVDSIEIGNIKLPNVALDALYDDHLDFSLSFKTVQFIPKVLTNEEKIKITNSNIKKEIEFITNVSFNTKNGTELQLIPSKQPIILEFGGITERVECLVINGPPLFFKPLVLDFVHGDYVISWRQFDHSYELHRSQAARRRYKYHRCATGTVTLTRESGKPISADEAMAELSFFARFLTYVRGGHSAIGHVCGYDRSGVLTFAFIGFQRADHLEIDQGWHGIGVVKRLPEVFELYTRALRRPVDSKVILRTIEFYRASNAAREVSLETALITSYAALETIVPHTLGQQAGWSGDMLQERIRFHDKLRAACSFIRLIGDPLEHSPQLVKRAKNENKIDVFELLAKFRNRIIHQGSPFKFEGIELHDAWQLSQWLCEIFVFHWIGYRGPMNDRRRYGGWRGPAVPVPLP